MLDKDAIYIYYVSKNYISKNYTALQLSYDYKTI